MGANIYRNKKPLFLFLVPAFLFLVVYLYYPFVQNIINSFMEIRRLGAGAEGWQDPWYANYIKLINDTNVHTALKNTAIMTIVTIVGQVGIALLLSLMVDNIKHGAKFYRTVYFFPIVVSATALGLMFNLFIQQHGLMDQLVGLFGHDTVNWRGRGLAMFTMMLPVMWQYVGFYFVILITGLNNIPEDLYEVAAIDGASKLQRVRYITLPLLHNVICTCVVLAVTGALKVFDLPWQMFPNGKPFDTTFLTGTYMYYQTMEAPSNIDYGSALAVLIVVLGVVMSKVVNAIFKEKDY